jgi:hypothetical protein
MLEDNLRALGVLTLSLRDQYGNVKQEVTVPNTVVNAGKAFIAQSMIKTTTNSPVAMTHMGVGTGVTAAAVTQTALVTELGTRSTVSPTNTTVTVTNDTIQYVSTFAAGNATGALTEAGIFNASSAGTMLCRTVFSVINKGADDSLTITWRVTIQ